MLDGLWSVVRVLVAVAVAFAGYPADEQPFTARPLDVGPLRAADPPGTVLRTSEAWEVWWKDHTATWTNDPMGPAPPPDVGIDWAREQVVVASVGPLWNSCDHMDARLGATGALIRVHRWRWSEGGFCLNVIGAGTKLFVASPRWPVVFHDEGPPPDA